jgi:hypothetical protein
MIQTLIALADRRVWFVDGQPSAAGGLVSGGLDLTEQVEAAVLRAPPE